MITTAYDYENQRWTTGPQAGPLLRRQLLDELALLESDKGQAYAEFIGVDRNTQIASLRAQVKEIGWKP